MHDHSTNDALITFYLRYEIFCTAKTVFEQVSLSAVQLVNISFVLTKLSLFLHLDHLTTLLK